MAEFNDIFGRATEAIEESKKLTTKDRKNLKKSVYCGPGRSFPCNDCSHVAAAKAFLGRSKFSKSTKQKIAACINRKAKQLGCGGEKKAKASEGDFPKFIELSYEQKQLYSSDIFATTKELVEKSLETPDLDLGFEDIEDYFEE